MKPGSFLLTGGDDEPVFVMIFCRDLIKVHISTPAGWLIQKPFVCFVYFVVDILNAAFG
jgi:hypothetical protein